jgi:hypothetical protein
MSSQGSIGDALEESQNLATEKDEEEEIRTPTIMTSTRAIGGANGIY